MYTVEVFYKRKASRKDGYLESIKIVRRFETKAEAEAWEAGFRDSLDCEGYKLESEDRRDFSHGLEAIHSTSMSTIMDAYQEYLANDKNWNY